VRLDKGGKTDVFEFRPVGCMSEGEYLQGSPIR